MIASSLRDADDIVDLLLNKEADVNTKSKSCLMHNLFYVFPFLCLFSFAYSRPISLMKKT